MGGGATLLQEHELFNVHWLNSDIIYVVCIFVHFNHEAGYRRCDDDCDQCVCPQVGCLTEEKDKFWTDLDEVVESIPKEERLVIGADFNGHVGEGNRGDDNVMGRYGDKARNAEGQMLTRGFRDTNGNGCGEHVFQKEGGTQGDL